MTDEASDSRVGTTFRLMYRSRDRLTPEDRGSELGDLFATARSNNEKRRITGALLLTGDWFIQVLEGKEADVRALFSSIEHDPRHDSVEVLDAGPASEQAFAHWSMAKVAVDGEPDIPLIAVVGEISPSAGRRTSQEQDRVLDAMREAANQVPSPG